MNFFKALENKSNLIVKFVEPGPKESPNNKTKKGAEIHQSSTIQVRHDQKR